MQIEGWKIEKARLYAKEKHTGHFRRDEVTPYFAHLEAVVANVIFILDNVYPNLSDDECEFIIIIAWLHDSIEDGRTTYDDILIHFGQHIADGVMVLTKKKGTDYFEYVRGIAQMLYFKIIKMADIIANLSDTPSNKQKLKYHKALLLLT
jgi:(p)ppGpp synthase/HD superfamily hydrolase